MTLINTVLIDILYQGRRDLQAKEALPQGPRNFVINVKFSIRLFKAGEERKPNKVIEN